MKRYISYLFLAIALFSCNSKPKLPETYGIYVLSDNNYIQLVQNKINFKGNLMYSIKGIKQPSGNHFNKLESFLVYQNGLDPNSFILSKLKYQNSAVVEGLIRNENTDIKLWVPDESIRLKVAPIPEIKDMYRLVPTTHISDGFYALHCGSLSGNETIDAFEKTAFDFILGTDTTNYYK